MKPTLTEQHEGGAPPLAQSDNLRCEQCGAPIDSEQRYCVECAARQTHAENPAISYFAGAASARRARATAPPRSGRVAMLGLFFIGLPLAIAVGVLVGRGQSNDNGALLAALRNQPTITEQASSAGAAPATAAPSSSANANLPSTGTLGSGFVIQLQTLPVAGTTQASADSAEQSARSKGATHVGLISPADYTSTPSAGSAYIVYSVYYTSSSAADAALAKLKSSFPSASVVAIAPTAATAARDKANAVLPGIKPTPQQAQQDAAAVHRVSTTKGQSYVQSQQGLPNVIVVPGSTGATGAH
jgi:hypothetical protein